MPLTEQDRQQLDNIVIRLQERGAGDTQIQAVVDEFKQKYDTPSKSLGRKALEFVGKATGITGFGKGLAGAAHLLSGANKQKESAALGQAEKSQALVEQARKLPTGSPERKRLLKEAMAAGNAGSSIAQENVETLNSIPTARQMVGSTAKTLATVGSFGIGAPAGLTAGARVGQAALHSGGIGAVLGGGTALEEGRSNTDALKGAVIGGAAGAITGGLVQGGVEAVRGLGAVGNSLAKSPLKQPAKTAKQNLQKVVDDIKARGYSGSIENIRNTADKAVEEAQVKITAALKSQSGGLTLKEAAAKVAENMNKYAGRGQKFSATDVLATMKDILQKQSVKVPKGNIPWATLNDIRYWADKATNPKLWIGGGLELTGKQATVAGVASGLRNVVQASVPKSAPLFSEQSANIGIRKVMEAVLKKSEGGAGLGMLDILSAGSGAAAGGPFGAIAGPIATRFLRDPAVDLNVGVAASALSSKLAPILQKLSTAERAVLVPLIQQAVNGKGEVQQGGAVPAEVDMGDEAGVPLVPSTPQEIEESNRAMVQTLMEYGFTNPYDMLAYFQQAGSDLTLEQIKAYMGQ